MPPSRRAPSFLSAPPKDSDELLAFPEHALPAGAAIHRVHRVTRAPWFFSDARTWRFTPSGVPGIGSCYMAERPVTGLLETFKGLAMIDEHDLLQRAHFSAQLARPVRLADCCAAAAGGFGINGEIHTTTDYAITQRWASALAAAGFDGIRYLCRSDPRMSLVGYALFDTAGQAPPRRWPRGQSVPIGDDLLREAEGYGLSVRPIP